jgi:hypothetical protein
MAAKNFAYILMPLVTICAVQSALATTITVACSGSGGGSNGLIAAIENANSAPGANTINLTPGCVYLLTTSYPLAGDNGLPPITGVITINGYGATIARSQPAGSFGFRILAVASGGNLTLNTVTIKGGRAFFNSGGDACEATPDGNLDRGFGGGLCVDSGGTATLNHSTVTENSALNINNGFAVAGGIYNAGSLTLNHSIVSKNTAIADPATDAAEGGGIVSDGSLTLEHSAVTWNTVIMGDTSNPTFGACWQANSSLPPGSSRGRRLPPPPCGIASNVPQTARKLTRYTRQR